MATITLRNVALTIDEQAAVAACMELLDKAPLRVGSDFEVDMQGFENSMKSFFNCFKPWAKVKTNLTFFNSTS